MLGRDSCGEGTSTLCAIVDGFERDEAAKPVPEPLSRPRFECAVDCVGAEPGPVNPELDFDRLSCLSYLSVKGAPELLSVLRCVFACPVIEDDDCVRLVVPVLVGMYEPAMDNDDESGSEPITLSLGTTCANEFCAPNIAVSSFRPRGLPLPTISGELRSLSSY